MRPDATARRGRSLLPVVWATACFAAMAVGVWTSRVGVDVLLIAGAALFLFTMDRTVGDWMAEAFGPIPAAIIFSMGVIAFTSYLTGRSDSVLTAAESRGYRGVFEHTAAPARPENAEGAASEKAAVSLASPPRRATPPRSADKTVERAAANEGKDQPAEAPKSQTAVKLPSGVVSLLRGSKIVFGQTSKAPALAPTRSRLTLSSARVLQARQVTMQVTVTANDLPVSEGTVIFMIDGSVVERAPLNSGPTASATFSTYIPGAYEAQARFLGASTYEPSTSNRVTLNVVPR